MNDEPVAEKQCFRLVYEPISLTEVISLVERPEAGAVLLFSGTVREWTEGKHTLSLAYHSYETMAVKEMQRIGDTVSERWPDVRLAIFHRLGELKIGETSVVIAVSSPHRAEAYAASRFAIEALKRTVPIWKNELTDGGMQWLEGCEVYPHGQHAHHAFRAIRCGVITVSDTRTVETDESGRLLRQLLEEGGHQVASYELVKDEAQAIVSAVKRAIHEAHCESVLLTGGTGIAEKDVTVEVVEPLLQKQMPGFGELFRYLSYCDDIGPAAMLSRALAGVLQGAAVFVMPGSKAAVQLALKRLILPELSHVVQEVQKDFTT